jgi:transcriptional regulator with XRE-family HTH domain
MSKCVRRQLCSRNLGIFLFASRQEEDDLGFLGQGVRQVREQRNVSPSELATTSGVELQQIVALEAGQLDPTYELLLTLAEGLGVRASAFVIRAEELRGRIQP